MVSDISIFLLDLELFMNIRGGELPPVYLAGLFVEETFCIPFTSPSSSSQCFFISWVSQFSLNLNQTSPPFLTLQVLFNQQGTYHYKLPSAKTLTRVQWLFPLFFRFPHFRHNKGLIDVWIISFPFLKKRDDGEVVVH